MSVLASILRAIDLFEDRLHQPVRVAEAAEAAGYSVYHFCRVFNQTARLTSYEYLIRRRLSQAAQDLLQTRRTVLDIALDYQFGSSEAFGRAFQRMFAIQPSRFRQLERADPRQILPRFTPEYLTALEGLSLYPQKIRHPKIEIAGWMSPSAPGRPDFAPLWEWVLDELQNSGQRGPPTKKLSGILTLYALLLYPHDWETRGCLCFAGVLAEKVKSIKVRLVNVTLDEKDYACFTCEGSESNLQLILEHLFHTWIPHSRLSQLPDEVLFEKNGPTSWRIHLPLDEL